MFDQVLQAISEELDHSIKILKAKSVSKLAMRFTKTGRLQRDIQQALKRELERFQKRVQRHYGISGHKIQAGDEFISEEYKECRGKQREFNAKD